MDPKDRPNHRRYIEVLRGMSSAERLGQAAALSERTRALFLDGLRRRFPELGRDELHALYLERVSRCQNQNY